MPLGSMTNSRAALFIGGATLLVAWLSSASSPGGPPSGSPPVQHTEDSASTARLAATVRDQSERLRQRLSVAPPMQRPSRNPFAFRSAPAERLPSIEPPRRAGVAPPLPAIEEPRLALMGVAEHRGAEGITRTAVLAGGPDGTEEMIMAAVGDLVQHRYTVTVIGTESVELVDATTGRGRRLTLQDR